MHAAISKNRFPDIEIESSKKTIDLILQSRAKVDFSPVGALHNPSKQEALVASVLAHLSADELLELSTREIAGKFRCSTRHLNRLFQRHFGFPIAAFRMEIRMLKAASLLRKPDASIIRVAEQCGFNHLGLFNTCFRRRFGVGPSQYRKQNQELLIASRRFTFHTGEENIILFPEFSVSERKSQECVDEGEDFQEALEERFTDFISRSSERIHKNLHDISDSTNRMLEKLERI